MAVKKLIEIEAKISAIFDVHFPNNSLDNICFVFYMFNGGKLWNIHL